MLPQPLSITDVGVRSLDTSHEVSSGSELADEGLVQRLAEVGWIVVGVGDAHGDADVAAEGRVPAVRRLDDEVVSLDELVVEQARREDQAAAAVDVEVVAAVVDVR